MRQLILDTETTGLNARTGDRIIEIGCVELMNRRLTGNNLHFYVNPERDSDPGALAVHGLTTEFLSDKPRFAEIAAELQDFMQGADLIIHNAPFDLGFLDVEFALLGLASFSSQCGEVIDTLVRAKAMFPGKRNSLDALCDRFGVDRSNRTFHGAKLDAQLLADVYINLTRGQDALLIDVASNEPALGAVIAIDLRSFELPVLVAAEQELAAHEALLSQLDKASNDRTIFRQSSNSAVA